MKHKMTLFALVLAAISAPALGNDSEVLEARRANWWDERPGGEVFPVLCRGPLEVRLGYTAEERSSGGDRLSAPTFHMHAAYFFTKSATPAGGNGASLAPGTCAWRDRAINDSEPNTLEINFIGRDDRRAGLDYRLIYEATFACSQRPGCVFEAMVHNDSQSLRAFALGRLLYPSGR
jgi:hypothetical protein